MAVALAALDAIVEVLEPAGARQIPLTEFLRLPGDRWLPRYANTPSTLALPSSA
jgi:CO/xanthine dehydrogenase FAD-binding subunit